MGVSCGPARFCLVVGEAECPSLVLRRGGVLALILRLSSRSASRRFVSSCRLARRLVLRYPVSRIPWRACSYHRGHSSRGAWIVMPGRLAVLARFI